MPAGSDNTFVSNHVEISKGGLSCEPKNLMAVDHSIDDLDGCKALCQETAGCNFFWVGDYNGVKLCRVYSSCTQLYREMRSNGALHGLPTQQACLIADPPKCWQEVKRREHLAGAQVLMSPECLYQTLFVACDDLLLLGGHGVESCGQCTLNPISQWTAAKPLPHTFLAGSSLIVSCADGYAGADPSSSAMTASEVLTCVDGSWLDSRARKGLSHFSCEACIQASKVGLKTFIESNKQETWFSSKFGKEIRKDDSGSSKCLLPQTTSGSQFSRLVSFQDSLTALPAGTGVLRDSGDGFSSKAGDQYGWRSQSGSTCDFPGGAVAAFSADLSTSHHRSSTGWFEITTWRTTGRPEIFNSGFHFTPDSGRFSAPIAGWYHFSANIRLDSSGGSYTRLLIAKNGNPDANGGRHAIQGNPWAPYYSLTAAGTLYLNANDYVSVYIFSASDSNYDIHSESGFSGHILDANGVPSYGFLAELRTSKSVTDTNHEGGWTDVTDYNLLGNWGSSTTGDTFEGFTADLSNSLHFTSSGWKEITSWYTHEKTNLFDSGNVFNEATGRFTARTTGYYHVSCNLRLDDAKGGYFRGVIAVDGSADINNGLHSINGNPSNGKPYYTINVAGDIYLTAGQYVSVFVYSSSDTNWYVDSESGFAAYFIGATVAGFHADLSESLHVSSAGWYSIGSWRTSGLAALFDSGNHFDETQGTFRAPSSGLYHVSANVRLDSAGGSYFRLVVAVNGNSDINNGMHSIAGTPTAPYYTLSCASDVYLEAGQTLSLQVFSEKDTSYDIQSETGFSAHFIGSSITGFHADLASDKTFTSSGFVELGSWRISGAAGLFDSDNFDENSGRFQAPVSGYYSFSANVRFDSISRNSYIRLLIAVDGNTDLNNAAHAISGNPNEERYFTLNVDAEMYVARGQHVSVWLYCSDGGKWYAQSESSFSGHLLMSRQTTGFDKASGQFVAPVAGFYVLDANVRLDGAGGSYTRGVIALNDNADVNNGLHSIIGNPVTSYYTHSMYGIVKLDAGDIAAVKMHSSTDRSYTIEGESDFSGLFLGSTIVGFHADKDGSQLLGRGWSEIKAWRTSGLKGAFDAGNRFSVSLGRFIADRSGYYHFSALLRLDGAAGSYFRGILARNSQTDVDQGSHSIQGKGKDSYYTIRVTGNMYLSKGDYASVFVYSHDDSSSYLQTESGFSGYLIQTHDPANMAAVVADPQNLCANAKWEIEVPNGPYVVTLTYGSRTQRFETSGCTLEGYNASAGVVAEGGSVSKTMGVTIQDGHLTFAGEQAAQCTGINSLQIDTANMGVWGNCTVGTWKMASKGVADNSYRMEYVLASGVSAGCLTDTGSVTACIDNDRNQLHSLDHFPLLVSQWTHWTASSQVYQGTCARGQGAPVTQLSTHGEVSCPDDKVLRTLEFVQKSGCGGSDTHQYQWKCSSAIPSPRNTYVTKYSACGEIIGDTNNWRLDKFRLECPVMTVLHSFKFESCGSNHYRYMYRCSLLPGFGSCEVKETDWTEGASKTLESLVDHKMECNSGQALRGFVLDSKVPVSTTNAGEIRYLYVCCQVPLALPVSIATASKPLPTVFQPWEGGYCPTGRVEGRLQFAQGAKFDRSPADSSTTQLTYDKHAGRWCAGNACVNHGPAHPIELPQDASASFEASPMAAFTGEFEGKGVVEYEVRVEEEEDGGGNGGLFPAKNSKGQSKKQTYKAGDFTLDTNFQSTVTFKPWTPSDCSDVDNLPTEGGEGRPTDRCYLAFCKARNVGGIETYGINSEPMQKAMADAEQLGQEAVGAVDHPCSHAFNDATSKRDLNIIWDITNSANSAGPGLTSEQINWCAQRDVERNRQAGHRAADGDIIEGVAEFSKQLGDLFCDATPDALAIMAPLGVGVGVGFGGDELCGDIVNNIAGAAQFVNHMEKAAFDKRFAENDAADCGPVNAAMQKIFCDLYCIEDAVKKGDKSILDTIGNLYEKIKMTTKEMFDFYIGQVLGKMGQLEGSMFARFDGISNQITGLSTKVDAQVDVTTGTLDKRLNDIQAKQKAASLVDVRASVARFENSTFVLFNEMLSQARSGSVHEQGLRELQNLEVHIGHQAAASRAGAEPSLADVVSLAAELAEHAELAHEKARWSGESHRSSLPERAVSNSDQMLGLMQSAAKASSGHLRYIHEEIQRVNSRQAELNQRAMASSISGSRENSILAVLRGQQLLAEEVRSASVQGMLVEFDKQWVALSQGIESFLAAANEHMEVAKHAAEQVKAYIHCKSSQVDYPVLLAEYRKLQVKRRASESALRNAFKELERRLTLIANILVDGGLLRTQITLTASELPREAAARITHKSSGNANRTKYGEAHHFFSAEGIAAVQEELASSIRLGLPSQLLQQTQSAFLLANHLSMRHKSMGMQEEGSAAMAMRAAWSLVTEEFQTYRKLLDEPHKDETGYGRRLIGATLDMLLPAYATPPASCLDQADASSIVWAVLRDQGGGEKLLVTRSPGSILLQQERPFMMSLATSPNLKPRICEKFIGGNGAKWEARDVSSADQLSFCSAGDEHPSAKLCSYYIDVPGAVASNIVT
eukprot:TRINITY_DN423_c1_g3_i1.p1 TRINITY_DN423_c1_g3~~TRINITY_DN423_c1_g3_i1.p1  ORF type:complete len:2561 (-),score=411.03 TRINITY_DN423_c1_g3_i1:97-7755(-)